MGGELWTGTDIGKRIAMTRNRGKNKNQKTKLWKKYIEWLESRTV